MLDIMTVTDSRKYKMGKLLTCIQRHVPDWVKTGIFCDV